MVDNDRYEVDRNQKIDKYYRLYKSDIGHKSLGIYHMP